MIIGVFSKKDYDCAIRDREYYLFDAGMAVANIILRATELGLVAHPIAGYDEGLAKEVLGISMEMNLITLIIIGKRSDSIDEHLTDRQKLVENNRPERLPLDKVIFINCFRT